MTESKANGTVRNAKYGATAGSAFAVTLLMVLVPASAGAGAHATVVLKAPYKGTLGSPNVYLSWNGCTKAKMVVPKWSALTGTATGSESNAAKTCPKSIGTVGAYNSAYASGGIQIAIPFKIGTSGNHSIASSWTVTLATTQSFTSSGCPAKSIVYPPPLYSYQNAYCEDGANLGISFDAYVVDLTNGSYYGTNYSYAASYNDSYWANSTYCYNYGTPTCSNKSGFLSYGYSYGYNDPGWSSFAFGTPTTFTLWTNGTSMVKTDRWALILSVGTDAGAFVDTSHLLGPWSATAMGALNMGTLGNGAKLNSVTIT